MCWPRLRPCMLGASGAAHSARRPPSSASCRATAPGRFHRPRGTESSTASRGSRPSRSRATAASACAADPRPSSKQPADRGKWRDLRAATRAGYDTRSRARRRWQHEHLLFHAERHEEARGRTIFDFTRPKALIYANAPGQAARPRRRDVEHRDGEVGPTPAGPILRWHSHTSTRREEAGSEASPATASAPGLTTPAGRERDASRLVHRRSAERVRDHRSKAGAVRERFPPARRLQAAVARAITGGIGRSLPPRSRGASPRGGCPPARAGRRCRRISDTHTAAPCRRCRPCR